MFTGIIKAKGSIAAMSRQGGDVRLTVRSEGLPWGEYEIGESIAVNGVCLTAVALHDDGFDTDVSVETLDVTALGSLGSGSDVNLEPAISLGERLGGHLVSGHVDCVGSVTSRTADARSVRLAIEIPAEYAHYVAKKGSVWVKPSVTRAGITSGTSWHRSSRCLAWCWWPLRWPHLAF